MAIESMGDLLKMFSEVTHEDRDSAIDFVNGLESKRVDMLSKSTQQEELLSSMTGKIEELNSEVETLNGTVDSLKSENTQLKAKNYDLLMQVPTGDPIPGGEDSLIDNKVGKDGEVYHISNLFSEGTIDPMNPGNPIPINQGQGAMTQNAN